MESRRQRIGFFSKRLNRNDLHRLIEETYEGVQSSFHHSDGFGRSQKAYFTGRLRRYVLEFLSSKEDYCYVFKPGFDYDLMDFGYSLSLRLRKGLLYRELFKTFLQLNTSTPKTVTTTDRFRFFGEYLRLNPVVKDRKSFLRRLIDESKRRGVVYVAPWGVVKEKL